MAFLEVEYVSKYFPEPGGRQLCVFKNVRLHIEKSEFVTTVGHSGCGKSTLLNIIAGLEKASAGAIILDGKETDTPGLDRMVVFQNFSLLPWMSVYENIRLAVKAAFPSAVLVFLVPPDRDTQRARLTGRATDAPEEIERRLAEAAAEEETAARFDHQVVNRDIEQAVGEVAAILAGHRQK